MSGKHQSEADYREVRGEDGKLPFLIQEDNVRSLAFLLPERITAMPGQNVELGGLVISPDSAEILLDFVPVGIGHMSGAESRPGQADQLGFDEVLAKYPAGGDSRVTGYYRTHLASEIEIREEDLWLLQRFFGERGGLFILIQAVPGQGGVLHLYMWTVAGNVRLVRSFPLVETDVAKAGSGQVGAAPVAAGESHSALLSTGSDGAVGKKPGLWIIPAALIAAVVIAAPVIFLLPRFTGSGSPPETAVVVGGAFSVDVPETAVVARDAFSANVPETAAAAVRNLKAKRVEAPLEMHGGPRSFVPPEITQRTIAASVPLPAPLIEPPPALPPVPPVQQTAISQPWIPPPASASVAPPVAT